VSGVIRLPVITTLDIPVPLVLDAARELRSVVVLGYDQAGEAHFASSIGSAGDMLLLVERFKQRLLMEDGA
jgi:hypothetical protein